jgi:hypothetical protein
MNLGTEEGLPVLCNTGCAYLLLLLLIFYFFTDAAEENKC